MKFSVLMSLYYKERPEFLEECLLSLKNQSCSPDEVVIVEDGVLTDGLYDCLKRWESILPIIRVEIKANVGLGRALNHGLQYCRNDIVARMDTDDICDFRRFEKQLSMFEVSEIDVCGSWVSEFDTSADNITSYRKTPEKHDEILSISKFRNPLNHPAVMYRKSAVLDVGGYDDVLYFEDYHLWLKLIACEYRFYNIQEPLVSMRAGIGQLSRRGGVNYARLELAFLKRSQNEGIMGTRYAMRNALIRFPVRVLPMKTLGKVYKMIRNKEA